MVIGAGAGGLVTAAGAAGVGARVAIVEEHLMGGDCLNVGCVPSKALIRCARAAHEVSLSPLDEVCTCVVTAPFLMYPFKNITGDGYNKISSIMPPWRNW